MKRTRLVQSEKYVVALEVELVTPIDDPSEPCYESETIHCYESETIQLLKEVKERADRGDIAWLKQHGKVYALVGAA